MSWNGWEANNLLRNEGPGADGIPRFSDVALAHGAIREGDARGVAVADYDNDGDLDLLIVNLNDSPRLLRNDGGANRWLTVSCKLPGGKSDAIGARVTVKV
ncbi:MAG: VCBS repeat-containing protein, partial [bacterium]|nr:VCBS repeat-containing protein [bacterium]